MEEPNPSHPPADSTNQAAKFWTVGAIIAASLIALCMWAIIFLPGIVAKRLSENDSLKGEVSIVSHRPSQQIQLQAKVIVGFAGMQKAQALQQADAILKSANSRADRRGIAAIYSYLESNEKAFEIMDEEKEESDIDTLVRRGMTSPADLTSDEQTRLKSDLGLCGKLLLAKIDPALDETLKEDGLKAMVVMVCAFLIVCTVIFFGVIAAIVSFIYWKDGKLKMRFAPEPSRSGPIYLEAFAVYLIAMFVLMFSSVIVPPALRLWSGLGGIFLAGFLGFIWPIIRGIPFSTVTQELGLHRGRGFFREIGAGFIAYLTTIPLLLFSGLISLFIWFLLNTFAQTPPEQPSHPIGEMLEASGGWIGKLLIVLMAAVAAPIVEELMFRGALQRALRTQWSRFLALPVMAFIFAAIHPQGIVLIPPLMALAVGFGMMREWRESLIPSMVLHGLHNGSLVAMMLSLI